MPGQASVNHVFRTIWNQALGAMVAVAEIASSAGGGTGSAAREARVGLNMDDEAPPLRAMALSILLAFSAFAAHTQTLPSGGVAVHGGAAFNTSQPNRLTVTTTNGANSSHSAINWNSFSIGSGNTTNFLQPNAASLSINRVVTNTPSQLFGTLSSNGKLVLVNQSGIAVGAGALVDTAGFTASALGMSQADAIAGRLRFAAGGAGLTVDGNIFARGGDVVLIAPNVDVAKTALIESQGGSVVLAAGQSVEVTGRGLEGITLQVQAPTDQAINLGTLKGDAVGIFAGTLRHSGMIQAVQANLEGGKVVLRAGGDAYVEGQGRINATSASGKGGSVDVLGNRVAVMDDAVIDVSGASGGGSARVGGDYQGRNAEVPNASFAYLGKNVSVKADATVDGAGGRVIFWADDTMRAYGSISARGGALGGDGGIVEVSGHRSLDFQGNVNTLAPLGRAGTLLLDPSDLTINNTTNSGGSTVGSIFTAGLINSTLTWGTINTLLSAGGLEVRTNQTGTGGSGNLTVAAGTTLTGTGFLNLVAHKDLIFNPGVSVTGPGDYTLVAGWNNTGLAVSPGIGNIIFGAGSSLSTPGTLFFNAGNSVSQSATSVITANRLGIGNTNPQPLPGGVSMPGANLVNILAVEMANPTALAGLTFNNAQNLTIGTAAFASGINAAGNPSPINITTGPGILTVSNPITTGGNLTLTGTAGITLGANVTPAGILNLNSSTGNGLIIQSGGDIVVGGATTANAGSGDVLLGQPGNDFNGISASGGHLTLRDANLLNVTSFTYGPNKNVYFQAGGALVIPAGPIATTAQVSLISGATLSTPGALTGSDILLVGDNTLGIGHNVTASNNLTLNVTGTSGFGVTQLAGTTVSVPGVTTVIAGTLPVSLDQFGNNFNSFEVIGGTVFLTDINGLQLRNVNVIELHVDANGPLTQAIGTTINLPSSLILGSGSASITLNNPGNALGRFGTFASTTGPVSVTNGNSSLNLANIDAGSLTVVSGGNIVSCCNLITTSSGGVEIRSTGGSISLNTDSPTHVSSAGAIKLQASGDVNLPNVNLTSNAGGNIVLIPGAGSLLSAGGTASATTNGGGRWLTYLTNPVAGHTFGPFSPTGFGTNFRQVNAPIGTAPIGAGNGSLWSDTGAPTGTLTGSVTKVFDGSNTISLAGATLVPSGGYLFGETGGSFLPGATGSLVNPNVGVGKAVTVTALPLTGVQLVSTLTTPTYGYVLTSASGNIGAVTPAALSVITLGGKRVYDGTNIVNADIFALSGLIGTQTLTLAGAGTVADKNIGVAKPVTLGSLALGNGTGLASNYTLAGGVHVATITPVNISISGLAASSKVYDGTTAAVVSTASAALTGTISGDSVGFSGGTGTFQDKNAGVGKTVGISGLALVGADAGNYNLVSSSTVAVADIFKASISGVTGITASNKVYDGKTVATLVTGSALVTGIVSGESVSVNGATGNFSDKNAGTGKTVAITGISLAGTDAGNYTLGTGNATAVADISKATISDVAGITARNKVYDATTAASINTAGATLVGAVAGDALGVSATGQFVDKNAGIGKTVNVSSITLTGPDAVNYTVAKANSTTSADISKASIGSVSGITASDKVYDGNTKATLSGSAASLGGVIGGDSVTIAGIAGEFTDRNVGSDKTVNINGGSLSGADGGNYSLSGGTAPVKASISVRPLSIWTAATGGQWSTAANWDALPDGNNVLAVSIPAGAGTVVLDANAGAVNLQSLSSQRPVLISGGALALRSDLSLASLGQTGGALAGTGGLTVSDNFRQTGGSMVFARDVAINQATGNLVVGEIGAPSVALSAPLGSIGQTAALTTPSLVTLSATGSLLTDAANRVNLFRASNTGAGDIALNNAVPLDVAGIRNADGNVVIKSTGGVNTSGLVTAPGVVSISANSPLRVGSDGIVAGDDVILVATNLTSAGNILINGPITSGGKVKINAGNNLTQNSVIFGAKGVTVDAGGVITFGPNAVAGRQPVVYSLAGVEVAPPLSGAQARANAAALPDSIVAFLDLFGRAQKRERADLGNVGETASNRRRNRDAIVAEEQTCRP